MNGLKIKQCLFLFSLPLSLSAGWRWRTLFDLAAMPFGCDDDDDDHSENGVSYPFCTSENGPGTYGGPALTYSEDDAEFAPKRVKPTRVSNFRDNQLDIYIYIQSHRA